MWCTHPIKSRNNNNTISIYEKGQKKTQFGSQKDLKISLVQNVDLGWVHGQENY